MFIDLSSFLIYFAFVIILFALLFQLLGVDNSEQDGLGQWGYIFLTIRFVLGETLSSDYAESERGLLIFTWLVWFGLVVICFVIFMNFIIAVISESYEKVMDKY